MTDRAALDPKVCKLLACQHVDILGYMREFLLQSNR
jgi:DNA-binding Xre family transcriptional regulator